MRYLLAFALAFAFGLMTGGNATQAASIAGTWKGGGTAVRYKTGQKETVRCQITYRGSGSQYGVSATCSTLSGKRRSGSGTVSGGGNRYSGRFQDGDIFGTVYITVRGNTQTVTVASRKGKGTVRVLPLTVM